MQPSSLIVRIAVVCLLAAAASGAPYGRTEGALWIAGNEELEIAVDTKTGVIERMLDKPSGEDYCNQTVKRVAGGRDFTVGRRIAGLTLFDELREREFSDLAGGVSVVSARTGEAGEAVMLTVEKRFPGAEFTVTETFRMSGDHLRWDVRIHRTSGPDRTVRVIQFAPLPLGGYTGWAPIADTPFQGDPRIPFAVDYGQSRSGSVGDHRWRTNIPMMVFHSPARKRALAFTSAFEVPAVRIRFLSNSSAMADFHWNSRHYPARERPYFQVANEYLGLRANKDIETSLLISAHPSDWRPALGWVYEKYRKYFDPDPNFDPWDGWYHGASPVPDAMSEEEQRQVTAARHANGVRWEELHLHFPWYGLMIPDRDVKAWTFTEAPAEGVKISRDKVRSQAQISRAGGTGTFLYYNTTESVYQYAEKNFPDSVARDEDGKPIGAWYASKYPDPVACWLMNSDPATSFGQHMIRQARELVETYPEIAGFFWDVYGRSYMFDFAHDDGITMVNNKPAYYPVFMFERMMRDHVMPLLRSRGMTVTANKPTTITTCEGVDGIMASEDTPDEETPSWIAAQSYLGLTRHVMILDGRSGTHPEWFLMNCFRFGMFPSEMGATDRKGERLPPEELERNARLVRAYRPYIDRFRGKKWVFHPEALTLPQYTDGNIFRARDGSVIVPVVSTWRLRRNAEGFDRNATVICRLPDAAEMRHVYVASVDLHTVVRVEPARNRDAIEITVPRHGKATMIVLAKQPDEALEAAVRGR